MPEFLEELLRKEYSSEDITKIYDGFKQKRNTTLRINTIKSDIKKVKDVLQSEGIKFKDVQCYENALILEETQKKNLQELYIYKNGEIYLQSLSSMLPPIVLDPKPKENILDMCAAPGGKTTQISAMSENRAYITACERNKIRMERLKYNVKVQGCKGVSFINRDARDLDDYLKFDKILLDTPCSGSGTINLYDENFKKFFTQELINKSVKTQKALLKKAIKLLKTGGELVYSTCSILKKENEEILSDVLNNNVQIVPIMLNSNIPNLPVTISGTICVMPCKDYEGFFVAKIKKM